jgi:ABC-2 type transport system permease protein
MTITSTAAIGTQSPRPTGGTGHIRIPSVIRSEWIKLRTVRSTWWTLGVMALLTVGIAAIAGATIPSRWTSMSLGERLTFDPTSVSLRGLLFSELVVGVLGVLVMSAEYGTGTIRATLAAVPNRPLVLAAKAGVFAVVALVVGEILSFAAFLLGQSLLVSPATHATLGQPGVLRAVVGGGLVIGVLGLFALGLATIIRHTAGAITAFVGSLLVLPIVTEALPSSINRPIGKFLPFNISDAMTSVRPSIGPATSFSPWAGFALLCLYAAAALGFGAWLMTRRDA